MKSSQSNFNLRSPGSYLVRSYLITTVPINLNSLRSVLAWMTCGLYFFPSKTISLLLIYSEYQSNTTIKTEGVISILQNLFLFLDIFYQNFPIQFLNSKPVNSEQFGSDQKVHYHQV